MFPYGFVWWTGVGNVLTTQRKVYIANCPAHQRVKWWKWSVEVAVSGSPFGIGSTSGVDEWWIVAG